MKFAGATGLGYPNDTPFWVANVTFEASENDGSSTPIKVVLITLDDCSDDAVNLIPFTTVQNGIFTTKDEVPPAIDIITDTTVSSTFYIAGTVTDVGGLEKDAQVKATLTNKTATCSYNLPLKEIDSTTYSFNKQVTWPVEDGVTLTVTATDAAGNEKTETKEDISVVDVGFSDPIPKLNSYISEIPEYASVLITEMSESVTMYLGNATYGKNLGATIEGSCAKGTLPCDLADGEYWVEVSGTDNYGNPQSLNWTFTLDTVSPVIQTFTITDSDGDGYIEAGEELTLNWKVTDKNFEHVALVDTETGDELWCCDSPTGTEKAVIDVGNRDLEFRAYDLACNSDSCAFHLYNNYMIWVNSTKVGKVSGIDTTYTAAKDLSRTGVSFITLPNARNVPLPCMSTLERTVTNLGQVTSDTYVTADKDANRTLKGSETYQNAWVYDPDTVLDFTVKVPNTQKAVLVLAEANESYIADLIEGGRSGIKSVDYMELVKKTAYIFIDDGWTKVTIDDEGEVQQGPSSGRSITVPTDDKSAIEVLRHFDNQVNLSSCYQLSAQKNVAKITLPPGDYTLAAITMDGDRIGLLAAMPVIVLESDDQGSISAKSVKKGGEFTAGFTTDCERLGVVLLRDATYEGTAFIDAAKLGKDTLKQTLRLNITHNDIPATQKLIGDVYVSPNSGKYVVANTNQATVSTEGLDTGTYRVYLAGQSANGTVQAYGMHPLEITSEVTPEPTKKPSGRSGGGGGGGGSSTTVYTETGTLKISSSGTVLRSVMVKAGDNVGSLSIPIGVKALDADGNPLSEIFINPIGSDKMPAVPAGALFKFAGYVYEAGPNGATFEPGITFSLEIPEDDWNALDLDDCKLVVKWYNKETEQWEDVPTTVFQSARSVDAEITHFSTYALFTEPVTTAPPTDTETPTTPTTPPAEEPPAEEGISMTMILFIIIIIAIIAAAGYFFMTKK